MQARYWKATGIYPKSGLWEHEHVEVIRCITDRRDGRCLVRSKRKGEVWVSVWDLTPIEPEGRTWKSGADAA